MTEALAFFLPIAILVVILVGFIRIANAVVGIERELGMLREDLRALLEERPGV